MADSNHTNGSGHIKVLYVDDDAGFIETSKLMLSDLNPALLIESCTSVDDALTKIAANRYDAVISDYEMPHKTGLDFLKTLREQNNKVPFILFTGKGREEVAIQALNLGADGYHNKQGSPETVYGELTHRLRTVVSYHQTRTSLSQSEEKFRKAFETIPDAVYVTALTDGKIIEINDRFADMFGYSRLDLIGQSTLELSLWANPSDRQTVVNKIREGGKLRDVIVYWRRKSSQVFPGLLSVSSLIVNEQELTLGVIKDISVLLSNQESLRKSEARWAATLSSIGDAVIATDVEGKITFMNQVAEQLTGWPLSEAVNKPLPEVFKIVNETTRKTVENPVTKVLRTGLVVGLANHTILLTKNGDEISIDDSGAPILDENRTISGVVLVFRNIGEHRKMERQLADSERKFRSLFNSMNEGAALHRVICNSEGNPIDYEILEVNGAYEVFTGIKREQAIGQRASVLYGINEPPYLMQYAEVASTGKNCVFDTYFKPMDKHFHISVYSPEKGKFATVFIDITALKKTEEELKKKEEQARERAEELQKIMGIIPAAIWISNDPECKTIVGNDTANHFYEALEGENVSAGAASGGKQDTTRRFFRNGKELSPQELPMQEAAAKNIEIKNTELEVLTPSGKKMIMLGSAKPLLNSEGNVRGCVGTFVDITERKKIEEDLASVNGKLRVIGRLVRHDVSNKLSSIRANVYLLRKQCDDGTSPKIRQYLSNIDSDVKSAEHLFDLSRIYEQIGVERPGDIDVERCFTEAMTLSPKLPINIVNQTSGLKVTADSLLKQVFYNFIDNSIKHGQKVTEIRLSYQNLADEIVLTYQDNGVGISYDDKPKLFTEGFSTGNGTGLGLAIIRKILQVYGWSIVEVGVPGEGVKFEITIPLAAVKT